MKLTQSFYERTNVVKIARDLIGKGLFTQINGVTTGGMIVETEAYSWKERGCHAFGGRKSERKSIMFGNGGYAYVYLCYGMHHLVNVVTNREDIAEAVLIRAIEPRAGLIEMGMRRGIPSDNRRLTSGPGKLTKALGIDRKMNAKSLLLNEIWLEDIGVRVSSGKIECSQRIGIDYAGEDAALPWRFSLKENLWVSR